MMTSNQTVLTDRAVIRIAGPEARGFLQGLLTQDVETLAVGELRYGALLTPQGRMRGDLFLFGEAEGVALDVAKGFADELMQALAMYRLRAKVEIARTGDAVAAAWGEAPVGQGWIADPRLAELGWRRTGPAAGEGDYRVHRIALGVADPADDAIEPLYPIEANLDLLNGIDFRKGCFVGQETTSRMKRRGQVKSRIVPITYDGPALTPGDEVMAGDLRAGKVLSGTEGRSLALLRLDRAAEGDLVAGDRPVVLNVLPWLAAATSEAFRVDNPAVQA